MENERSLHELYKVLWEKIKDKEFIDGLCTEISALCHDDIISFHEHGLLINHFNSQKPSKNQHSEFINDDTWIGGKYWWSYYEDLNPVNRKRFIQKMIEITRPRNVKNLLSELSASQNIIDSYLERIEKEDKHGRKKAIMLLLKYRLSAHSRIIDSLIIKLNLEKADVSEMERELSLILNKEQDGN